MSIEASGSIQAQPLIGNAVKSPLSSEIKPSQEVTASVDEIEIKQSPYPSGMFWKDSEQVTADAITQMDSIRAQLRSDSSANRLGDRIERAFEKIETESPGLSQADWGLSIDENGGLVLTNTDALTEDQQQLILDKLNEAGVAGKASAFADDMVAFLEADRGSDGYSNNIGQYDLTRANFSEIIDLKEHYQNGRNEVLGGFAVTGMGQIADQLSRNADPKYLFNYQF